MLELYGKALTAPHANAAGRAAVVRGGVRRPAHAQARPEGRPAHWILETPFAERERDYRGSHEEPPDL
jgi:hypothetical protein